MNVWTVSYKQDTYCDGTFYVLLSIYSTEEKAREAVAKEIAIGELNQAESDLEIPVFLKKEDDYLIEKKLLDK